jgi:hypothetical protein
MARVLSTVNDIGIRSSVKELFGGLLGIPDGSVGAAKFAKIVNDCETKIRALDFDFDNFAFPVFVAVMNRFNCWFSPVPKLMRRFSSFSWTFGITRGTDNAGFHAIQDELFWFQKLLESIPEFRPGDRFLRFVELVDLINTTWHILAENRISVNEAIIFEALVTDENRNAVVTAIAETNEACKPLRRAPMPFVKDRLEKFELLLAWTMRMLQENLPFLHEWGKVISAP